MQNIKFFLVSILFLICFSCGIFIPFTPSPFKELKTYKICNICLLSTDSTQNKYFKGSELRYSQKTNLYRLSGQVIGIRLEDNSYENMPYEFTISKSLIYNRNTNKKVNFLLEKITYLNVLKYTQHKNPVVFFYLKSDEKIKKGEIYNFSIEITCYNKLSGEVTTLPTVSFDWQW